MEIQPVNYDSYIYPTGFEKAIVGVDMAGERWVMDKCKMIDILMEQEEWTEEDAIEYLSYNVWGAYVGEHTPIYMDDGDFEYFKETLNL